MRSLRERQGAVLQAVVTDYIRTAEPVGSGTVARRYRLGVSAATIRNEMAALEEMGYLAQPHTSAGRIPTDRGYRFYVDALPRRPALPGTHRRAITAFFVEPPTPVEEVLRQTAALLSRITHYSAVAQPPESTHVFIGGVANIVGEATFERRTVRSLLEALEEEATIVGLLDALARGAEVGVGIGRENALAAMRQASVVVAPYRRRGRPAGAVAVIGPTRMHYPEAISTVRAVATGLSRTIDLLAG